MAEKQWEPAKCEEHGKTHCFPCWERDMKRDFPNPERAWND